MVTRKRYSPKASDKVERAIHEMKEGKLRSGRSNRKVTSRKQAIAIGLSEAREAGAKVPKRSKSGTQSKSSASGREKRATKAQKKTPKKAAKSGARS